ncbi:DNA-binding protein, partial [Avibacterium paragallinarum]
MKVWFSAKELAGVAGLSKYPTNVTRLAKKEKWTSRPLVGVKGGGVEYALSSFPQEVQEEIRDKFATSVVVAKPKKLPVMRSVALTELTEKQRQAAEARMALVAYVLKLEE